MRGCDRGDALPVRIGFELMVLFGYPLAHENDAERAARSETRSRLLFFSGVKYLWSVICVLLNEEIPDEDQVNAIQSGFTTVFATIKAGNPGGLLILVDPLTLAYVKEIAKFAAEKRLPAMFGFREFCDAGGLLCYGANLKYQFRRYGYFIDKILKGTKAGDIPIEEPTIFELIVNARTATLLDLSIPNFILVSADEVIE